MFGHPARQQHPLCRQEVLGESSLILRVPWIAAMTSAGFGLIPNGMITVRSPAQLFNNTTEDYV
jgi:hypothetical protein